MKTQPIFKRFTARLFTVLLGVALLLTACSPQSSTTATATATHPQPTPLPQRQTSADDHTPVFLRVAEWEETRDGRLVYHNDATFTDTAGDAQVVTFTLLSGNLTTADSLPPTSAAIGSSSWGSRWAATGPGAWGR